MRELSDTKTYEQIQYWMIHLQDFWVLSPTSQPQILVIFRSWGKNTKGTANSSFKKMLRKKKLQKNDWYIRWKRKTVFDSPGSHTSFN